MDTILSASAETAAKLWALVRRQFRGFNGIQVTTVGDTVSIGLTQDFLRTIAIAGAGTVKPVLVRQAGGASGSQSTQCTFAYDFAELADTAFASPLGTAQQPLQRREALGRYIQGASSTYGLAGQIAGNWRLLFAFDERRDVATCSGV